MVSQRQYQSRLEKQSKNKYCYINRKKKLVFRFVLMRSPLPEVDVFLFCKGEFREIIGS